MRYWQFWLQTLILYGQHNPPQFVELVMLTLAMVMLGIWGITNQWPYLVLCASYVVGSAASSWVREAIALRAPYQRHPSSNQGRLILATIVLLISTIFAVFSTWVAIGDLVIGPKHH